MTEPWLFYLLWTVSGSALGGVARFGLSSWIEGRSGTQFPLGTLVVNVSGAFAIGLVAFLPWEQMMPEGFAFTIRLFLIYGFLGGYTTVSAFSLQTLQLIEQGDVRKAVINITLSVGLCLAAVAAGAGIVQLLNLAQGG